MLPQNWGGGKFGGVWMIYYNRLASGEIVLKN
jgi:hypothetical protein